MITNIISIHYPSQDGTSLASKHYYQCIKYYDLQEKVEGHASYHGLNIKMFFLHQYL